MGPIDLIFKHIFDPPTPALTDQLFSYLEKSDSEIQYYGLEYILGRVDLDSQLLLDQALQHFDEGIVMTAAEQLINKGMQKEKQEMAKRLLFMRQETSFISKATKLTEEEIARLANEVDDNSAGEAH